MDADDRLRLDYEQTSQLLRTLTDIRFRLIAFVPTFAAVSVALFARPRPAVELLAIGTLGLVATFGIYLYELKNSQLYAAAAGRARELERRLELSGGDLDTHDRGLSLVYGAALAGWSYIVGWGLLRATRASTAPEGSASRSAPLPGHSSSPRRTGSASRTGTRARAAGRRGCPCCRWRGRDSPRTQAPRRRRSGRGRFPLPSRRPPSRAVP